MRCWLQFDDHPCYSLNVWVSALNNNKRGEESREWCYIPKRYSSSDSTEHAEADVSNTWKINDMLIARYTYLEWERTRKEDFQKDTSWLTCQAVRQLSVWIYAVQFELNSLKMSAFCPSLDIWWNFPLLILSALGTSVRTSTSKISARRVHDVGLNTTKPAPNKSMF